jgi:hypothetical protein
VAQRSICDASQAEDSCSTAAWLQLARPGLEHVAGKLSDFILRTVTLLPEESDAVLAKAGFIDIGSFDGEASYKKVVNLSQHL